MGVKGLADQHDLAGAPLAQELPVEHDLPVRVLHAPLVHVVVAVQVAPGLHAPAWQVSLSVQPLPVLHLSSVHGLPSLHATAVPLQPPPLQASPAVQALPSLHAPLAGG